MCIYGHMGSMAYESSSSLSAGYGLARVQSVVRRAQIQLPDEAKHFLDGSSCAISIDAAGGAHGEARLSVQSPLNAYDVQSASRSRSHAVGGTSLFWRAKRVVDIIVSLMLLPALGALFIALFVLNRPFNRGPVFYSQKRMGQDLKAFKALKFRTMLPEKDMTRKVGDPIEIHRITPLGMFLRKTRFDELPQIINVLRGEMSLIGPRPDYYDHAREYLDHIPEYRDRHTIRPGISGLAQVTLGYASGIDQTRAKASADLAYIRNASFGLELRVFWLTLVTVFMRRGA